MDRRLESIMGTRRRAFVARWPIIRERRPNDKFCVRALVVAAPFIRDVNAHRGVVCSFCTHIVVHYLFIEMMCNLHLQATEKTPRVTETRYD